MCSFRIFFFFNIFKDFFFKAAVSAHQKKKKSLLKQGSTVFIQRAQYCHGGKIKTLGIALIGGYLVGLSILICVKMEKEYFFNPTTLSTLSSEILWENIVGNIVAFLRIIG